MRNPTRGSAVLGVMGVCVLAFAQLGGPCDRDGVLDADADGVPDSTDNCPTVANADQADVNSNGIGDACENTPLADRDSDGIADSADNCPDVANASQADADGDGVGDACDSPIQPTSMFVEVPNPLSGDNPQYKSTPVPAPEAGQSVTDSVFGTTQTRVIQTESLRHEYSRYDPFNRDQSMILLVYFPAGERRVYRTHTIPYDQDANLVRTVDLAEARWDPNDPALLWGVQGFRIVTLNVLTGESTTVKDFAQDAAIAPLLTANPDLYRVTMRDEGESSTDKRFWALIIEGTGEDYRPRYLLTWDRQTDQILGLYTVAANQADIDWVGMSPKGTWVLIGGSELNAGDLQGLLMANRELTQFHRIDYATGHADVGLDTQGNEVIVMQNIRTDYIDMIPIDPATQPILEVNGSYAGTNRVPLIRLFYDSNSPIGLNSDLHVSCNAAGYCVVSTYIAPGLPEQNWLDRKIILVRLDRSHPRAFHLAQVYGTRGEYWEETQASITNDGSRVVWATNWNQNVGQTPERVWLMQLNMPAGWMSTLGGGS